MSRSLRAIAALAITGLLLAGCATPPNTAAVVNGERWTETEVADALVELEPAFDSFTTSMLVESLIQREILMPAADDLGMSVSQEEIDQVVETQWTSMGEPVPDSLSRSGEALIEFLLLANKVNYTELGVEVYQSYLVALETADVQVNPRFGTLDQDPTSQTFGSLQPAATPWIATQ